MLPNKPQSIIIRMPNWLGDDIMALPMIAGLKKIFPDSKIDIAIKKSFSELGALLPFIDKTIALPDVSSGERKTALASIALGNYDAALILPNSFRSAWEMWRANVTERIGYSGEFRSMLLTKGIDKPAPHSLHQSDYFNNLAKSVFPNFEPKPFSITPPTDAIEKANNIIGETTKPLIGIGFGATYGSAKMWPTKKFSNLIYSLSEKADVLLIGAESDREVEQAVMADTISKPKSLVGLTDIPTLAAVLSRLSLYITNDTGPMHLASAIGTNVLAIFGPTDPNETKPLGENATILYHKANCAPCWKRRCPTDHRCMMDITVDEVLQAAFSSIKK